MENLSEKLNKLFEVVDVNTLSKNVKESITHMTLPNYLVDVTNYKDSEPRIILSRCNEPFMLSKKEAKVSIYFRDYIKGVQTTAVILNDLLFIKERRQDSGETTILRSIDGFEFPKSSGYIKL